MVVIADQDPTLLRLCLRALSSSTGTLPYRWSIAIVETSGGGRGSSNRESIAGASSLLPAASLIFNESPTRLSSAAAMTIGSQWAGEDAGLLLFLHESVELHADVLHALLASMENDPRVGVVRETSGRS